MRARLPIAPVFRLFVATAVAGTLAGSTTDVCAQSQSRGPRPSERPVQRTLPRKEIYENLGKRLGVKGAEAKSLTQAVEDKGFPIRETVVLLLVANARASNLIDQGKFTKQQRVQAIRTTADYLIDQVDKDQAGWLAVVDKSEAKVSLSAAVAEANDIIGFYSERAGNETTVPAVVGKPAARPAQPKQ